MRFGPGWTPVALAGRNGKCSAKNFPEKSEKELDIIVLLVYTGGTMRKKTPKPDSAASTGKPHKRLDRQPKPDSTSHITLSIRLRPSEEKAWKAMAKATGQSLAAFLLEPRRKELEEGKP